MIAIWRRFSASRDLHRSSAIYAIPDRNDSNHEVGAQCLLKLLESGDPLFTTNYVLVESCALAQNRFGIDALRSIQEDLLPVLEIAWVDETIHSIAMAVVMAARHRKLSLVDCVSFAAMRQRGARVL
jgi:predicted nucleic acid-binding protein